MSTIVLSEYTPQPADLPVQVAGTGEYSRSPGSALPTWESHVDVLTEFNGKALGGRVDLPPWTNKAGLMRSGSSLSIGDFARATHVSVKMLRHYHHIGLLEPTVVDQHTGYRRYTADQIPVAQVIRRFRAVGMPLERIHSVLDAPDLDTRNRLISEHLESLQAELAQTQSAVASLRDLLEHNGAGEEAHISHRRIAAASSAAISEAIDIKNAQAWYQGAYGELYATLAAQDIPPAGTPGGIYSDDLFASERGQATVFVPCVETVRPVGRVVPTVIPAVELAVIVHEGAHRGIDRSYGALAAYVTRNALAVDGPIREYYVVAFQDTFDESQWRTEIGWPVFLTGPAG
jgi:DNA-binding transcriptional MerR regulator